MPRGFHCGILSFIFLACFLVYLRTLNPAFQPDDSGETIATFARLISEHPSGYPLHSLVGHLFSLLPVGGIAFRANLLGALAGSFGVALLATCLALLLKEEQTSKSDRLQKFTPALVSGILTGSLSLAFSKSYWSQALSAKGSIYILQACLLLGFLIFFQKGLDGMSGRRSLGAFSFILLALYIGILRLGIGLETLSLFAVAFLLSLLVVVWKKPSGLSFSWKKAALLSAVVLVGGSVLLLPPLYEAAGRPNIWADTRTLKGLQALLSNSVIHDEMGSVYWKGLQDIFFGQMDLDSFREHAPNLLAQWKRAWNHLAWDMGWWSWLTASFGFMALYSRRSHWLITFNLALIGLTTAAMVVGVEWNEAEFWCIDKFLIPANVFIALLAGAGAYELFLKAGNFRASGSFRRARKARVMGSGKRWLFTTLLLFSWIVPFLSLASHFPQNDQSRQTGAYGYSMDLMKSLKGNALFLAEGDNAIFSTLYLQEALAKRQDVTLLPVMDFWTEGGIGVLPRLLPGLAGEKELEPLGAGERVRFCADRLVREYGGRRPIEISADFDLLYQCYFKAKDEVAQKRNLSLLLRPCGLLMEYGLGLPKPLPPDFLSLDWVRPAPEEGNISEPMDLLLANKAQSYLNAANYYLDVRDWEKADVYFSDVPVMTRNPRLLSESWRGRGDLYEAMGQSEKALEDYRRSISLFGNAESYYQLIALYSRLHDPKEALETAEQLARVFPYSALSWYKLAACEEAIGNKDKAFQYFQRGGKLERK